MPLTPAQLARVRELLDEGEEAEVRDLCEELFVAHLEGRNPYPTFTREVATELLQQFLADDTTDLPLYQLVKLTLVLDSLDSVRASASEARL